MNKQIRRVSIWSKPKKIAVGVIAFIVVVSIAASGNHNQATINSAPANNKSSAQTKNKSTIVTKTDTEIQAIPYGSETVNDATLAKGTSKITTAGVNGSRTLTYKITYTNGKQTKKQLMSNTVTIQPVTQVTSTGTYVASPAPTPSCSNGSYINSAGDTVCSPSSSPSGATAKCGDGTYSYSQSRSGTCSHHGGVAEWL